MYKYWFNLWSYDDEFEDGLYWVDTVQGHIKEHGKEKLIYAEKNGWLEFYTANNNELKTFDSWDITDNKTDVEMHFNAVSMELDRHLLNETPKCQCPPLKRKRFDSMDTQYDSDENEEQKLLEVHEMNPPKRTKVEKLSEKELWEFWYGKWEKTTFCKGGHYEYPIIQEDRKLDPVYYEGAFKDVSSDLDNLSPGIEKGYITMWDSNGKEIKEIPDDPKEGVIRLNPNTLMNNMHLYCDDKLFEHRCVRMELHGWYMLGVRYRRDLERQDKLHILY